MLDECCKHLIKAAQRGVIGIDQEGNRRPGFSHAGTLATTHPQGRQQPSQTTSNAASRARP